MINDKNLDINEKQIIQLKLNEKKVLCDDIEHHYKTVSEILEHFQNDEVLIFL